MNATRPLDDAIAAESRVLVEAATAEAYRRYLSRLYGFVVPLERELAKVPDLRSFVGGQRFDKQVLLRRDLEALNTRSDDLQCCGGVPTLNDVQTALGWAYVTERSSLGHTSLFHSLAALMPREAAFASSYLKCYFGGVGEAWRNFVDGLDAAGRTAYEVARIVGAAQDATTSYLAWTQTGVPPAARSVTPFVR